MVFADPRRRRDISAHPSALGRPTSTTLRQVAQAADALGYFGVLLPTGRSCEDPWVIASAVAPFTEQLKYLVAARPGLTSVTVAARMAATLDRVTNGRLLINVVTGGDPVENKGDGLFLGHAERYEVTSGVPRRLYKAARGETVNYAGKHISVEDGRVIFPPVQPGGPPLYFGGSSPAGIDVATSIVDKYLTWGEPPAEVAKKVEHVRAAAAAKGRKISFGIRLHVIVRETAEAAWKAADKLISYVTDDTIGAAQKIFSRMDSVGQQRMVALHGGRRDKLEISPNLWAGVGLVRGGAGTALVGDPETVAARIKEYMDVGIDTFILSGYPHLEEAYRFAELVFPLLPLSHGKTAHTGSVNTGPFGETIANDYRPEIAEAGLAIMSAEGDAPPRWTGLGGVVPAARSNRHLGDRVARRLGILAYPSGAERRRACGLAARAHGRALGQHGRQLPARHHRARDRRHARLRAGAHQRPFAYLRDCDRHAVADGAQRSASGAHSSRHFVVRHRGDGEDLPCRARRLLSDLHQYAARHPHPSIRSSSRWAASTA